MKELLKNSGNVIEDIKVNKNTFSIKINGAYIKLNKEVYSLFFLYKGKILSTNELDELKTKSNLNALLSLYKKYIIKYRYSRRFVINKLAKSKANNRTQAIILSSLEENGFIDDSKYIYEIVFQLEQKGYGKKKIIKELSRRMFLENDIKKIAFDDEMETMKANLYLDRCRIRYKNYPYQKFKERTYNALLANGFDYHIVNQCMKSLQLYSAENEKEKLIHDCDRIMIRYKKRFTNIDIKSFVHNKLKNKGYSSEDINEIWRQYYDNDK